MSGDGKVVCGALGVGRGHSLPAYVWTAAGGVQMIEPTLRPSTGHALNRDGTVMVGSLMLATFDHRRVFRWTRETGIVMMDDPAGSGESSVQGVTADGSVVVGYGFDSLYQACRWIGNQPEAIGFLPGGRSSYASGVSADGRVVVGGSSTADRHRAFRWTAETGMQELALLPGFEKSSAAAVSADGLVAVGYCQFADYSPQACMWTSDGAVHALGVLGNDPKGFGSNAFAVSAHGDVIVGSASGYHALLWTRSLGMLDLGEVLTALGVDHSGVPLHTVGSLSWDGATMVSGYGSRPWFLTGLFCPADYNRDTFVDGIDYDEFLSDFESTNPAQRIRADLNFDGAVDASDYGTFINDFLAGC